MKNVSVDTVLWRIIALLLRFPGILPTLVFLSIATYYDVRYREIDTRLFISIIPAGILSYILVLPWLSYMDIISPILTCTIVLITYLLARRGVMGKGDPFLIAVVGLLNPYVIKLWGITTTPLMLTLVFGTVYVLALVMVNIVYNVRNIKVFMELTRDTRLFEKIYYFLAGRVMSTEEFKRKKYFFPLVTVDSRRLIARVGYEPLEGSEYDIKGSHLIASHGFAFAALLLTGYILYIIVVFVPAILA